MKVGDVVKFYESAKHKVEDATITKVHEAAGLFNVEVVRGKVKHAFHSVGIAMEKGGAYIVAKTEDKPSKPTPTPSPTPPLPPSEVITK